MIKNILDLLIAFEHFSQSEAIEIAKGKYELQTNFKGGLNQINRYIKWLNKK
jgi:hypothetical protein